MAGKMFVKIVFTSRVDYKKIQTAFEEVSRIAQEAKDIHEFNLLIKPIAEGIFEEYYDKLLSGENYIEGEFAGLLLVMLAAINEIIPAHISYRAMEVGEGGEIIFRQIEIATDKRSANGNWIN